MTSLRRRRNAAGRLFFMDEGRARSNILEVLLTFYKRRPANVDTSIRSQMNERKTLDTRFYAPVAREWGVAVTFFLLTVISIHISFVWVHHQ